MSADLTRPPTVPTGSVSVVIRRRAHQPSPSRRTLRVTAIGAVLGTVLLVSSCGSLARSEEVAEVAGHTLTLPELKVLATDPASGTVTSDGSALRGLIGNWVVASVLLQRDVPIASSADLEAAFNEVKLRVVEEHGDESAALHDKGLDGAEFLCLAVIPIDITDDSAAIIAEIEGGMTFAKAAEKYSRDPNLASTGGAVVDQNGQNCVDTTTFVETYSSIGLFEELVAANATPGHPVPITINGAAGDQYYVIELRSFDELSIDEQVQVARTPIQEAIDAAFAEVRVNVASRYGVWDSTRMTVVEATAG